MSRPLPVVINIGGGAAARAGDAMEGQIRELFVATGFSIDLHLVQGAGIAETVRTLADKGSKSIVVGGGDGTLGTTAAILSKANATLGILPLGTRNHFARELGIPMDMPGAVDIIGKGKSRAVDLSEVDGHVFINNASIGLYPHLVHLRDAHQKERNLPKWLANFPAAWESLKQIRHHWLRLTMDDAKDYVRTPLLFVGNNIYSLDAGRVGSREALDDGKLSVFAVASQSRVGLVGFAIRTALGLGNPDRDFATLGDCERLTVDARGRKIDVALDGEVLKLETPLRFSVSPGALSVFAPALNI